MDLSDLDQKIGRLFMCGLPGTTLDEETRRLIKMLNPCGMILFSRNIRDPAQVAGLCRDLQEASLKHHGAPLFLAVDQEGGRVSRLKSPFTEFAGGEETAASPRPILEAERFARVTAREMRLVGLNMDMAPVMDVRRGEPEEHLRGRTFGDDPHMVARLGRTVIRTLQEEGVMAVAKHFPGLGLAGVDPHRCLPRIDILPQDMEEVNLIPFRAAVEEGVAGIMTSHAVYPILDPSLPATLSQAVLEGLLRGRLGYQGLIVTDDLEMGAVATRLPVGDGAAAAFAAGADILLICKDQALVWDGLKRIRERLLRGDIAMSRLLRSVERIERVQRQFLDSVPLPSPSDAEAYFTESG
ncbi:MAG: glycoside hydrolase family 3 N-terminal domain-containing protein [Desulfobacteraceae bacterium]